MRQKKKTILVWASLVLGVVLVGGTLSGCGTAAPKDTELLICAKASDKVELDSFVRYYRMLYPDVRTTVQYIPESFHPKTGEISAERVEKHTAALQALRVELMAGKGPDLFLCSQSVHEIGAGGAVEPLFPDVLKSAQAGAFADLSPYIKKDSEFVPEDYIQPLFEACKLDGKQYMIPYTCSVPGVTAMAQALAETGFNEKKAAENFASFWAELTRCVPPEELAQAFLHPATLLLATKQPLVSYSQHKVFLDSPVFTERYAALQQYTVLTKNGPEPRFDYAEKMEAAEKGNLVLDATGSFSAFYLPYLAAAKGLETRFLPIPTEEGGAAAVVESFAAVRANSNNKQNAWNFIKILLSEPAQRGKQIEIGDRWYLPPGWLFSAWPVHKAAFAEGISESRPSRINEMPTAPLQGKIVEDWASLPQRIIAGRLPTYADATALWVQLNEETPLAQTLEKMKETLVLYLDE